VAARAQEQLPATAGITNAVMFSYLMTSEQIPQTLAAWMLDKGLGVVTFLLVVNVLLLLAGNVMEPSSIV
jgi:C4-dicarboxylate transporter, DctM subunit